MANNELYQVIKEGDGVTILKFLGICTTKGSSGEWCITTMPKVKPPVPPPILPTISGKWVGCKYGQLTTQACHGGVDCFGYTLYVTRSYCNFGVVPGYIARGAMQCHYGNLQGAGLCGYFYEVLCGFEGRWIAASDGEVPPNAIIGGRTYHSQDLYVARAYHRGGVYPGYVLKEWRKCFVAKGWCETGYRNYEVLCGE